MTMEADLLEIVQLLDEMGHDADVALFHVSGGWSAEASNPSRAVMLGEATGRFRNRKWGGFSHEDAKSPSEAVAELLAVVRAGEFNN